MAGEEFMGAFVKRVLKTIYELERHKPKLERLAKRLSIAPKKAARKKRAKRAGKK
jgi:Mn-dependent DtxR family transcriptional regulator